MHITVALAPPLSEVNRGAGNIAAKPHYIGVLKSEIFFF